MQFSTRTLWLGAAGAAAALAAASVVLTLWLHLQPCHLCIFQRLLFMLLGVLSLLVALFTGLARRVGAGVVALVAAAGAATAGYQSWLQLQPAGSVACVGGELGPIERLVEWLGQLLPSLFLATGFCDDEALVIFGLSLVNWALLAFVAMLGLALWTLLARRPSAA
jgi:disulfide bond formation protein DsbB